MSCLTVSTSRTCNRPCPAAAAALHALIAQADARTCSLCSQQPAVCFLQPLAQQLLLLPVQALPGVSSVTATMAYQLSILTWRATLTTRKTQKVGSDPALVRCTQADPVLLCQEGHDASSRSAAQEDSDGEGSTAWLACGLMGPLRLTGGPEA